MAAFVTDVTLADDTVVFTGDNLIKTWRIKNIGSCAWQQNYRLTQVNQELAESSSFLVFNDVVSPGETVDISIPVKIPAETGIFEAFWFIETESGDRFGVGSGGKSPLWIKVVAVAPISTATNPPSTATLPPTNVFPQGTDGQITLFDFYTQYCDANWFADDILLDCPAPDEQNAIMRIQASTTLETGQPVSGVIALHLPLSTTDTRVSAVFPPLEIETGDRLIVGAGCLQHAINCSVLFNIYYLDDSGQKNALWVVGEFHDGQVTTQEIPLSFLAGKPVTFVLEVSSLGSSEDDIVAWISPRIIRDPVPTPTATFTPSSTPVPTLSATPALPAHTVTPSALPVMPPDNSKTPMQDLMDVFFEFLRWLLGG